MTHEQKLDHMNAALSTGRSKALEETTRVQNYLTVRCALRCFVICY